MSYVHASARQSERDHRLQYRSKRIKRKLLADNTKERLRGLRPARRTDQPAANDFPNRVLPDCGGNTLGSLGTRHTMVALKGTWVLYNALAQLRALGLSTPAMRGMQIPDAMRSHVSPTRARLLQRTLGRLGSTSTPKAGSLIVLERHRRRPSV